MDSFTYKITGEGTDQIVTLKVESQIIYEGPSYSLVTSVDNVLGLDLNFGFSGIEYSYYLYSIKCLEEYLLLLPMNAHYKYANQFIFSKSDLMKLWDGLGYAFEDDQEYITNANPTDILLHWFLSSRVHFQELKLDTMRKEIRKIAVGYSEDKYRSLFEHLMLKWDDVHLKDVTKITSLCVEISIYLDQQENYDWKALFIDEQGVLCMRLSPDLGIRTNVSIN
ncbi:hypothetical protein [Paenibacillus sp. PDC88]|uniref:hypothetical protein n=1 Tax=Paenibacillus sp. PDC88 TaxID=1884375 RepID=UPI0008956856|nr:hypothetical protein [Paenibacillus sp. PDC88]SDX18501.1 hypothetical protein SAMN05518848_10591 [Paenibacillus sp. PDC88]